MKINKESLIKLIQEELESIAEDTDGFSSDKIEETEVVDEGLKDWLSKLGLATAAIGAFATIAPAPAQAEPAKVVADGYEFVVKNSYDKKATIKVQVDTKTVDEAEAFKKAESEVLPELNKKSSVPFRMTADNSPFFKVVYKDGSGKVTRTVPLENSDGANVLDLKTFARQYSKPGEKPSVYSIEKSEYDQISSQKQQQKTAVAGQAEQATKISFSSNEKGIPSANLEIDLKKLPDDIKKELKTNLAGTINKLIGNELSRTTDKVYGGGRFKADDSGVSDYDVTQTGDTMVVKGVKLKSARAAVKENKITKQVIREMIEECMHDMMQGGQQGNMEALPPKQAGVTNIDPDGYEGEMAKGNLFNAAKAASSLHNLFGDQENLEPWVEEKIAIASNMLKTVADYIEYQKMKG